MIKQGRTMGTPAARYRGGCWVPYILEIWAERSMHGRWIAYYSEEPGRRYCWHIEGSFRTRSEALAAVERYILATWGGTYRALTGSGTWAMPTIPGEMLRGDA